MYMYICMLGVHEIWKSIGSYNFQKGANDGENQSHTAFGYDEPKEEIDPIGTVHKVPQDIIEECWGIHA